MSSVERPVTKPRPVYLNLVRIRLPLPGIVSMVPKAAISYAGTYVVGQTAHYYYRWGHRPRRETLEQFSREAAALAKRSVTALR